MFTKKHLMATVLILGLVAACTAVSIQWVDSDIIGPQSLVVKFANGSTVGTYNTSAGIMTLDGNLSYIFTLRPTQTDYLRDPAALVDEVVTYVSDNAVGIIAIAFLIFLAFRRR